MRVAISMSGQPYTYRECINTFNTNIFFQDIEVFSHFWWNDSYLNKCFKMHYNMKSNNSNILNELKMFFHIKELISEPNMYIDLSYVKSINLNTWPEMSLDYHRMMVPILLYGVFSQINSINKSVHLIDTNVYDVIIRTRPDIVYLKDIKSMIKGFNFADNTIYVQSSNSGGHLYAGEPPNEPCDWFYMGTANTMKVFTKALQNSFKDKFKNGAIHLRDFLKTVASDNNIKLELIDFGAVIYKQTPLFDKQYKNKIEFYLNNFDFENNCVKNIEVWPYWIDCVDFKHFKGLQ